MNTHSSSPPRQPTLCALLALSALFAGCVTESDTRRTGIPLRRTSSSTPLIGPSPGPARTNPPTSYELPSGPIAAPVTNSATTVSHVEVGVVPLGAVSYNGDAIPLASPDARFIVVQDGDPPAWEATLAEPAAEPPLRSTLVLYEVTQRDLRRVPLPQTLPPGLILGRSSDPRGFLVEAPQANGSRWIGRVAWATGSLEWLVQGRQVCAHAVFTATGDLAYTRRDIESDASSLVLRSAGGAESVRPASGGSYAFPMSTQDASVLYALRLSHAGIELEAIRLDRGGLTGADAPAPKLGATIAVRALSPKADMVAAFQMASTVEPVISQRAGAPAVDAPLAFFHPRMGRMAVFNIDSQQFEPLAPKSQSAARSMDPARPGFYCTTADGLVFVPSGKGTPSEGPPTVRVLASPYVPRRVAGTPETMMLFGPIKGRPEQLEVVKLVIGPRPEPAPRN